MWQRALDEAGLTEAAIAINSDARSFTYPHRYDSLPVHNKVEPGLHR